MNEKDTAKPESGNSTVEKARVAALNPEVLAKAREVMKPIREAEQSSTPEVKKTTGNEDVRQKDITIDKPPPQGQQPSNNQQPNPGRERGHSR